MEMQAIQYDSYGPPEVLKVKTISVPELISGNVLVRVAASSVNGADISVRSGKLKFLSGKKFPKGTGFDFTGEIVEIGTGVSGYKVGDKVWGFINNIKQIPPATTTAEYVSAPIKGIALLPHSLDIITSAALTGAGSAALKVLQDLADVKAGDRVLIKGASGGVGSIAIQIAVALGATVTALTNAKTIQQVKSLGATNVVDYCTADMNSLGKFDVILDPIGKDMKALRQLLNPNGKMYAMNLGGFGDALYLLASKIYGKRRVRFVQAPPSHESLKDLAAFVDKYKIVPAIEKLYSMEETASAHRSLETPGGFGKRVIQIQKNL